MIGSILILHLHKISYQDTRLCVVRPKKPARHTVSIFTGRKKTQFSHLCSSVILYAIETTFSTEVPTRQGCSHTKYEENRSSHFRDTSGQSLGFFFVFFSSTSFCTLYKICHKMRTRTPIRLQFGTLKGLIKADFSTNFGRNPMNIHRVITKYFRKTRSKVCHTHRVNPLKECTENCYVDKVTIVGVPFCGLKGI